MSPPTMNRAWLQGQVVSAPTIKALSVKTKVTSFQISVVETWLGEHLEHRERRNIFGVEVLGRDAQLVFDTAHMGSWVTLEGYLRSDEVKGQHVVRLRTLTITVWEDKHGQENSRLGGVRGSADTDGEAPS